WPGNVRELGNLLSRLAVESPERISPEAVARLLPGAGTAPRFPRDLLSQEPLPSLQDRLEHDYIVHHFSRLQGDSEALRRFLGLGERQLYRRCRRLGISLRAERRKLGGG
ncbi:MAG: hypothetical protein ACRD2T_04455, partial [Thermoanaerobaculia bacterium]